MSTCSAFNKSTGAPCTNAAGPDGYCFGHRPKAPRAQSIPASVSGSSRPAAAAPAQSVDPAVQARVHAIAVMPVAMMCLFLPLAYRPAAQEIDAILLPLERILIRHTPALAELNDDAADAIAALGGVCSYVGRAFVQPWVLRSFGAAPAAAAGPVAAGAAGPGSGGYGGAARGGVPQPGAAAGRPAAGSTGYPAAPAAADRNGHAAGFAGRPTLEATLAGIHASALVSADRGSDGDVDDAEESYQ